jgi:hypothetical protein
MMGVGSMRMLVLLPGRLPGADGFGTPGRSMAPPPFVTTLQTGILAGPKPSPSYRRLAPNRMCLCRAGFPSPEPTEKFHHDASDAGNELFDTFLKMVR